jgi:NAD(P)H dehydrogenase (quinone)
MKEKILVMTANGHVGFPTACELLSLGFQVRAFVRNPNSENSKKLKELGAELFVGNQDNINDLKKSLKGVQRAFYNSPASSGHFSRTETFIKLTEEEGLEHVVYLTQWLSSENHHSPHTREHWLADEAVKKHKKVNYTFVNPGLFAFFYFMTKEVVAHFGMLPTPIKNAGLGKIGLNAPPSEEDQGRVVAHILKEPTSHASKTYRPTGPKLISLTDVVAIFSKITGKEIKIAEVSQSRFLKSLNSMDAPKVDKDFMIMNVPYYQEELGRNSFAVGPSAVTSVVKDLTGKEPEDFETIARREFENSPELKPTFSNKMKAFKGFLKIIFASEPSIQKLESKYGIPTSKGGYKYAQENPNWVKEHESQQSKVSA